MASPDPPQPYPLLRDHVEGILTEGKVHSRRTGEWAKVEAYWHVGDALQTHFHDQPRAEYGQQTVRNLSRDLGLSESLLWDILLFRRSLPTLSASRELGWTTRQLRAAIKDNAFGQHTEQPWAVPPDEDPQQGQPLRARFGVLYTYKMVDGGDLSSPDPFVDLGFGITCRAGTVGLHGVAPDQVVTITQAGGTRTITVRPPNTRRYTYTAWVQRVVDGDTLIAIVDLGLDHQTRPLRFRLRGIDCPELGTQAGRNAKAFVQDVLGQVGFVVLTTHKTDNYGRYLADVRYRPGEPDPEVVRQRGAISIGNCWIGGWRDGMCGEVGAEMS